MGNTGSTISRHDRSQSSRPARLAATDIPFNNRIHPEILETSSSIGQGTSSSDGASPRKRNRFSPLRNPFKSKDSGPGRAQVDESGATRRSRTEGHPRRRRTRSLIDSSQVASEDSFSHDAFCEDSAGIVSGPGRAPHINGQSNPRNQGYDAPLTDAQTGQLSNEVANPYSLAPPLATDSLTSITPSTGSNSEVGPDHSLAGITPESNLRSSSMPSLSFPAGSSSHSLQRHGLASGQDEAQHARMHRARRSQAGSRASRPSSNRSQSSQDTRSRSGELVSPMPGEDQAGMLSRLLSVAAAATAASLVGHDNRQALRDAREVAINSERPTSDNNRTNDTEARLPSAHESDANSDLVDGSFDGFLAALQSGRLAQALRNGGNAMGGGTNDLGPQQPLNFFRMFRFSSAVSIHGSPAPVDGEGRMIPIIIVGIRSVPSREDGTVPQEGIPPFFDSLGDLDTQRARERQSGPQENEASLATQPEHAPAGVAQADMLSRTTPIASTSEENDTPVDGISRVDRHASEVGEIHSPEEADVGTRELSMPAEPALGVVAGALNDVQPSVLDAGAPRRGTRPMSGIMDTVMDRLRAFRADHNESASNESDPVRRRRPRPSWRPFSSSGAPTEETPGESSDSGATRSWIIYVLGGTYPENHPILTTPSLFTDSPTYEDMLLLSSLIGPAKPETAAAADLESAGPTFEIPSGDKMLQERCQICLTEYEAAETCRTLTKCTHCFHRECIDEWLTTGRNNCPLCRTDTAARTKAVTEPPTADTSASNAEATTEASVAQ